MANFTPVSAAIGGALIGLAAVLLMLFTGRIAGISGIAGGLFNPRTDDRLWRLAFIAGLIAAPLSATLIGYAVPVPQMPANLITIAFAGVLVGFAAVVGGQPSVLRATVMGLLLLAALLLDRESQLMNALALAVLGGLAGLALVLHKHDELIGTSALVTAAASLACSAGSSSLSPRRFRHSTSPCSAHTLSGCWVQRWTLPLKPRSSR